LYNNELYDFLMCFLAVSTIAVKGDVSAISVVLHASVTLPKPPPQNLWILCGEVSGALHASTRHPLLDGYVVIRRLG
jgi:hypothetical protein